METLTIIDIGTSGDGIVRDETGQTVFVPFTVPGDRVDVSVLPDREGILRGVIKSVVSAGPERAIPPCRHFGICGGCSLQHFSDGLYQQFKTDSVLGVLKRHGIALPEKTDRMFIPAGTRRRANFAARVIRGRAVIGFHEKKSSNIRDVPDCLLITDEVRGIMEGVRPFVPRLIGEGEKIDILIQCVDGVREIALTGRLRDTLQVQEALADTLRTLGLARISIRARDYDIYKVLLEEKHCFVRFGRLSVNLAPGGFLQPSAEGEAALRNRVMEYAGDASCVADLFCGNGTFTGSFLEKDCHVLAADFAPDAIAALKAAGVDAQMRNLFKEPFSAAELAGRDLVVLDPPRAGAMAQARVLAASDVPRIVYVSCNPQSFAKDAAVLIDGGYELSALTIVDQFVWSVHTEIVGCFTKTLT